MLRTPTIKAKRAALHSAATEQAADLSVSSRTGRRFRQRLLRVEAGDELPLTLRHERIYILPTLRGLAFVAVSLVMILASMNYGLNLGYALSFILVGLFASCLLSTYLNLSRLTLQSISSTDTYADNPIEYHITVVEEQGKSRYSITLEAMDDKSTFDVKANVPSVAVLRHSRTSRGEHTLGRITLSSDFPLGLWRGWGYVHAPTKSFIYPKPETPVAAYPFSRHNNSEIKTPTTEEREFDQLKRYQESDAPSAVAWKTVASGRGWFSKEFTGSESSHELEFSWTATEDLTDPELRLSRICAWILKADATSTPYELELPASTTKSSCGPEHLRTCLRKLACFTLP